MIRAIEVIEGEVLHAEASQRKGDWCLLVFGSIVVDKKQTFVGSWTVSFSTHEHAPKYVTFLSSR